MRQNMRGERLAGNPQRGASLRLINHQTRRACHTFAKMLSKLIAYNLIIILTQCLLAPCMFVLCIVIMAIY